MSNANKFKPLYDSCNELIFTAREESMQIALNEIKSRIPSARLVEWLGEGAGIVRCVPIQKLI